MKCRKKIAWLMILAMIQLPCVTYAAEEDKELSLIAAEQEHSGEGEELDEINPALTEGITTKPTQETDKDKKERKRKLRQARKEKERDNERRLRDSENRRNNPRNDETVVIEPTRIEPIPQPVSEPEPTPQPVSEPEPQPQPEPKPQPEPQPQPAPTPQPQPISEPVRPPTITPAPTTPTITGTSTPTPIETVAMLDQKVVYANFTEISRAIGFIPLYMPRKSGYEITALYAGQGIAEVRYGRKWEPTVSLTVRTHKRAAGEELQDISGVTGVKWRVDTSTGTTIYIAKISETRQVAAWAVGHYTFSAQAENLSYAGFHSLVADELVELSTHYYLDL